MRNTIILYIRMIVTLLVSLYTSRVTLELLGIEDFGIYGVVGSIVALFAFLSRTLTASFNRYLCKSVARGDNAQISRILGAALQIQILIIISVIVLGETIGIWFINNYLVIAPEKITSAHIVFQISILTFIFGIFSSAFSSIIIAFERMTVYACICIFEVLTKLGATFMLSIITDDRLVYYALFICAVQFVTMLLYSGYVKTQYTEIKPDIKKSKTLVKEMLSFVGYGFIGSSAFVIKSQGINFLLNIFGGPVLNAARSISFQVYTAVYNFVGNFQTAFSPYILKKQELDEDITCNEDVIIFTNVSFGIMGVLVIPILFATHFILHLWLGENVPSYTEVFVQLILLIGICEAISSPLQNIIYGSGRIKCLQLTSFVIQSLVLILSFFLLRMGYSPVLIYAIDLVANILLIGVRLLTAAHITNLRPFFYLRRSILPMAITTLFIAIIYKFGFIHDIIAIIASEIIMAVYLYFIIPQNIKSQIKHNLFHQ